MKNLLQAIARRFGYRISRDVPSPPDFDAFAQLRRLCEDIAEPVIFDVGAHHGHTARAFRQLIPSGKIYAFEPFQESYRVLRENTTDSSNIRTFNYGLSDTNGVMPFHANLESVTNSLLPTDIAASKTWKEGLLETKEMVEAEIKTIDVVVEELGIRRIDILKLDVQGAEHLVMKGASEACKKGIIRLIYSEIITQPTYQNQKRFDEALAVFYESGFDLHGIYNPSLTAEGRLRQVDAIFAICDTQ